MVDDGRLDNRILLRQPRLTSPHPVLRHCMTQASSLERGARTQAPARRFSTAEGASPSPVPEDEVEEVRDSTEEAGECAFITCQPCTEIDMKPPGQFRMSRLDLEVRVTAQLLHHGVPAKSGVSARKIIVPRRVIARILG